MMVINTERLVLKKLGNCDKERLVALIGNWRVTNFLSNVPYPYTMEDADQWLEIVNKQQFNLNIFLNDNLIGGVGLTLGKEEFYELGYWLGIDYWGQGYATEAAKGLLDCVSQKKSTLKVRADVLAGNTASANVLEKIGFRKVGDGEVFSLSRKKIVPCARLVLE